MFATVVIPRQEKDSLKAAQIILAPMISVIRWRLGYVSAWQIKRSYLWQQTVSRFRPFCGDLSFKERDSIHTVTYSQKLPSRSDDVIAHHHHYHHNESGCGRVPVWHDSQRITCPTTKAATIIQQTFTFEKNSGHTSIIRTQRWLPSCNCCNCLFREASLSWYILQWDKPRLV